jgi:hypothetical protein
MIFSSNYGFGQQNRKAFEMVKVPDSVKNSLISFLTTKEKHSETGAILIYNLINSKDYKYKDGIYAFRMMGPHFSRNIFIVSNGKLQIFNGYYISELLSEFNSFIQKENIPYKIKIKYLKAISTFLEEEYIVENN